MKYKVGDRVRIVSCRTDGIVGEMDKYLGTVMTIKEVFGNAHYYLMQEDGEEWFWHDDSIEGLVTPDIEPSTGQLKKSDNGLYTINW